MVVSEGSALQLAVRSRRNLAGDIDHEPSWTISVDNLGHEIIPFIS